MDTICELDRLIPKREKKKSIGLMKDELCKENLLDLE